MNITVKVAKLNTELDFDVESMPPTSLAYAIQYGLTQTINDAHASVARKNFDNDEEFLDAVRAKVDKRHAQLRDGNVPGARVVDPTAAKVRQLTKIANANPRAKAALDAFLAEFAPEIKEAA